jgi:selenocysteine-specific elongation factor
MTPPRGSVQRLVLGTAGHIDHGKTALVRALTGVDTDRLPEEKARGITIELGFALLDLGDGVCLSVVDVPGHERLVRTMVAGATGIDLVLLVVAADEGVMPQTREHVAICEGLGLEHGVVAMTKIDRVDGETAARTERDVRALLEGGSLAGAAIARVSALRGDGLDALRAELARLVRRAAARTPRAGPARLAVDRAFALRGFGTVVTGTLVGAGLDVGQTVELWPSGRRARVRGLHSHGAPLARAEPGIRTAINLQDIGVDTIARGDVVSELDALAPTGAFDAQLHGFAGAPAVTERISALLLTGTAERSARVSPIGEEAIASGATGFVRVHVEGAPLSLLPGDRFVLRGFARLPGGGTTIAGGTVLDVAPPRRRRGDPQLARDLDALAHRDPETDVWVRVVRSGLAGTPTAGMQRLTGLRREALAALADRLVAAGRLERSADGSLLLAPDAARDLERRVVAALARRQREDPLAPGVARGVMAGAVPDNVPAPALELALARLVAAGRVATGPAGLRLATPPQDAALADADRAVADAVRAGARSAGLRPPTLDEWAARLGRSRQQLRPLLAHLEREGALVRAPGDLWFDRAAVDALRERILAALRESGGLETPAYKQLIGTTRKHAVPLMELFDSERTTLRVGNRRVLRRGR